MNTIKQLLAFFLLSLFPIIASAEDKVIEYTDPEYKVCYVCHVDSGVAWVKPGNTIGIAYSGSPQAKGDVVIKESLIVDGKNYTVTEIGEAAFAVNGDDEPGHTRIKSVTIPATIEKIGRNAFGFNMWSYTITSWVENPPIVQFGNGPYKVYVLESSMDKYKNTSDWSNCPIYPILEDYIEPKTNLLFGLIVGGETAIVKEHKDEAGSRIPFSGNLDIPDIVKADGKEYAVTCLGENALMDAELTSVHLPQTLKRIEGRALYMHQLHSLTIPEGVEFIGYYALPTHLDTLRVLSEVPCERNSNQSMSNTLLQVPKGAVERYQADENWNKFRRIEEIGSDPVIWEDTVYHIRYSLYEETGTASVLAGSPYRVGSPNAHGYIRILDEIKVDGKTYTVTSIGEYALAGESVDNWSYYYGAESEEHFDDDLPNIQTCIVIPATITSIGSHPFHSYPEAIISLIEEPFPLPGYIKGITWYSGGIGGVATPILFVPRGTKQKYETTKGWYQTNNMDKERMFKQVREFDAVDLDNGLVYVSDSLTQTSRTDINRHIMGDVVMKNEVPGLKYPITTISSHSLGDNEKLTSIVLPESVTTIENDAFNSCRLLRYVQIPSTVTTIGFYAFAYCGKLEAVTSYIQSPFDIENNVFSFTGDYNEDTPIENVILYVPAGTVRKYREAKGWNRFTHILEIASVDGMAFDCHADGTAAVRDGSNATGVVTIPEKVQDDKQCDYTVTAINEFAFENNTKLTDITLPYSITDIGFCAFYDCSELKSVTSCILEPFPIDQLTFAYWDENEKNNVVRATLYVPTGTRDRYLDTEGWNLFPVIEERDGLVPDGIHAMAFASDCSSVLYTLDGRRVQGKNLRPGLYIRNGRKTIAVR